MQQQDGNYIVQHSVDIDKPVIVVTFNYRLGCFGFLSSQELKGQCDNAGQSSRTNLGFHDQRLAFQWVGLLAVKMDQQVTLTDF